MNYKSVVTILTAVSTLLAFDHEFKGYSSILAEYTADGGVDYDKLSSKSNIISSVKKEFESVDSKQFALFSEKQQIAFLINVYNFYTIDLIVKNLPLKTGIRDIKEPWDQKFVPLFDQKVSLNYIEHELLRKKYTEPRIHFALVCASTSCPELLNKPFIADSLDSQLDFSGKRFLTDKSKNRMDNKTLHLSKIFEWYGSDFDKTLKGGYLEYVGEVLGVPAHTYKITFLTYDWSLNKTSIK